MVTVDSVAKRSQSTAHGLKYLRELGRRNAQIQRLTQEIDMLERNKLHMQGLSEEYDRATSELTVLSRRWETEYEPALAEQKRLLNEFEYARSHFPEYMQTIVEETKYRDGESIENEIWGLLTCNHGSRLVGHDDHLAWADGATITADVVGSSLSVNPSQDTSGQRTRRAWTLGQADERTTQLESHHQQLLTEMRLIGSRTCVLTVQLKKLQDEIAALRSAMALPPEHLFSGVKHDLNKLRAQALRDVIRTRPSLRPANRSHAFSGTTTRSSIPSLTLSDSSTATECYSASGTEGQTNAKPHHQGRIEASNEEL